MATKKKPTHEIRFGAIRATIWTNVSSSGERWYTVITSRRYKDKQEQWQDSCAFSVQHLPDVAKAFEAANLWIEQHSISPETRAFVQDLLNGASNGSGSAARRSS